MAKISARGRREMIRAEKDGRVRVVCTDGAILTAYRHNGRLQGYTLHGHVDLVRFPTPDALREWYVGKGYTVGGHVYPAWPDRATRGAKARQRRRDNPPPPRVETVSDIVGSAHASWSDLHLIRAIRSRHVLPAMERLRRRGDCPSPAALRAARKDIYRHALAQHHNNQRTYRHVMGGPCPPTASTIGCAMLGEKYATADVRLWERA